MKLKSFVLLVAILIFTGCFKVGRLPGTTASGPSYEDPKSAIVVPANRGTQIFSVNGESVQHDFFDRLANTSLNLLLMYLEPQVHVNPGENTLGVRNSETSTATYGTYTVETTRWRDYGLNMSAESGMRYLVVADLYGQARVSLDPNGPAPSVAAVPEPVSVEAPKVAAAKPVKAKAKAKKKSSSQAQPVASNSAK